MDNKIIRIAKTVGKISELRHMRVLVKRSVDFYSPFPQMIFLYE